MFHAPALSDLRVLHLHRLCYQPRCELPPTAALTTDVVSRTLTDIAALPRLESLSGLFDSVDISPLAAAPSLTHLSLLHAAHANKRPASTQVASLPHLLHLELRSPPLYRVVFSDLCESATGRRLHTLALRDVPIAKLLRSRPQTTADLDQHFGRCFSALQSLRMLTLGPVAGVELLFPHLIRHQPLLESLVIEPSCTEPDCEVDLSDPANATFASADSLIRLLSSLPRLYVIIRLQRRRVSQDPLELLSAPEFLNFGARFRVQIDPSLVELGATLPKPDHRSCQTIIDCGEVQEASDGTQKRVMSAFVPFFNREVEIYTAVVDPLRRPLYRASALAEKFGSATNQVGMYLARRRSADTGIFQATSFRSKPQGRTGLKVGGYFLTMEACLDFEAHCRQIDDTDGIPIADGLPSSGTADAAVAPASSNDASLARADASIAHSRSEAECS